jgi:hypothetical protein
MTKVLVTAELGEGATLQGAREQLGLEADEIDDDFGLVPLDPDRELYALMVEDDVVARLAGASELRGPFSNAVIDPSDRDLARQTRRARAPGSRRSGAMPAASTAADDEEGVVMNPDHERHHRHQGVRRRSVPSAHADPLPFVFVIVEGASA